MSAGAADEASKRESDRLSRDTTSLARGRERFDHEKFKNIASGIQSVVVGVGLVVGGIWTAMTFTLLSGMTRAVAESQKAIAEAETVTLTRANRAVVDCSLSVKQLTRPPDERWLLVELSARNSGNEPVVLDTREARFYVVRVRDVDSNGAVAYEDGPDERRLRFDYPDARGPDEPRHSLVLRPKADYERVHTVQRVNAPGLYLLRFSAPLPDDNLVKNREYSAETYFVVE
jgi:hypothetical protein